MAGFIRYFVVALGQRLLALVLVIALLLAGIEAWQWFGKPEIIRGIASGFLITGSPRAKSEFSDRVRTRFPIGSPEAEVVGELMREGFYDQNSFRGKQWLIFREGWFPCMNSWRVGWRADSSGTIEEIDGLIDASCL